MSKSLTMLSRVVCILALIAQPLHEAAARPPSSSSSSSSHSSSRPSSSGSSKSFSGGFSSRKSSSSSSSSSSYSPPSSASSSGASSSGGFGSFGKRAAGGAPQRSDSALSRQLSKQQAEANALRTLEARRSQSQSQSQYGGAPPARSDADRDMRNMPAPSYYPPQAPNPPVVVHRDSGLGDLVGGYVLGRMANGGNGGHARPGYGNNTGYGGTTGYPAPTGTSSASGGSFFGSLLRLALWVGVLALLAWGVVAMVRRARRRREQNKPNYSFQRRN